MEDDGAAVKREEINTRLDGLFEHYLELVDEYDRLRDDLSQTMSTGFLSIAKANFSHNAHHGRYGQDYYDDRMKAIRRIRVKSEDPLSMSIEKLPTREEAKRKAAEKKKREDAEKEAQGASADSSHDQLPTPPESRATSEVPELDSLNISDEASASASTKTREDEEGEPLPRDPLSWFGILVPPSLRSAQGDFVQVTDQIPKLAEISREMRQLEGEIGRGRKALKRAGG